MDRQIPYPGALPRSFDFSQAQQNAGIALGWLAQALMGSAAWCAGLACAPTAPASLQVNVGPGILAQETVVEETPFGTTLVADTTDPLMKMGINIASTVMAALTPPATSGQSQCWLLQGQMLEQDGTPVVLPYVNPTTPSQPFSGPGNSGAAQNTQRTQTVALQWVAGAPATTGTQTVPAVTAGWVPLYVVTLANGATVINAGNIAIHPASPFVPYTVPAIQAALAAIVVAAGQTPNASLASQVLSALRYLFGGANAAWHYVTTSTTITRPSWANSIEWELVGGGGGGGAAGSSGSSANGGGGAAGGFAAGTTDASGLSTIACTIGAGGTRGNLSGSVATSGGATSLGTIGSATGGAGGNGGDVNNGAGGAGGNGFGGDVQYEGQNGGDGGLFLGTGSGFGGSSAFGGGGTPSTTVGTGVPGTGYGTGGGGSYNGIGPGANGTSGLIRYRWKA